MLSLKEPNQKPDLDVILSSSGVRVPCFVGGLQALEEKGYIIRRIAGTSGGAIVAAAYALGYTISEMQALCPNIPYSTFREFSIFNLFSLTNPSVYTGRGLDAYYQSLYGNATLKDFKIDCSISVVTIVGRRRKILTKETHPDMLVWKAVRMSSTIPFIFPWYELDGEPVTDGALVTRMYDIFPNAVRPIVALRPRADYFLKRNIQNVSAKTTLLWNYLRIVAEHFLDAIDSQHIPENEWSRTITIPTFETGSFNFTLTPQDIDRLIQYGYNAVIESDLLPRLS